MDHVMVDGEFPESTKKNFQSCRFDDSSSNYMFIPRHRQSVTIYCLNNYPVVSGGARICGVVPEVTLVRTKSSISRTSYSGKPEYREGNYRLS
jgi:hypothetical protein